MDAGVPCPVVVVRQATGLAPEVVSALIGIVGPSQVLTAADTRAGYEVDWTGRFRGSTSAVVRPADVEEVAAVVRLCRTHGISIVAQGGNTGMVGGSVPLHGELVLSLRRLQRIDPVDIAARQITVGAGATVADVQLAADAGGLRYAVDFGARASATIGGSIATNAGGINVLRYGGTREQLVGVEAVLGTGDVISHLDGLVKDNTGYHLPSLLCGSEGTLGIVTAARLRLVTRYDQFATALVAFETADDAVAAVAAWRSSIDSLEAAEIVLDAGVRLVCDALGAAEPFERAWPVYVLVEAASHVDPTDELAAGVSGVASVRDVAVATDRPRRQALWRLREEHSAAIGTVGVPHKFDVTIPMHALAAFLGEVPRRVGGIDPAARTWLFGHVGDGNIHVNVTGLAADDPRVDDVVLAYVGELGGSISAEHGIGTAKAPWLHLNRSGAEIAAMRAIKRALDPDGVLNPHALLPEAPTVRSH